MSQYDPRYDAYDSREEEAERLQAAEDADDARRAAFLALSEDEQEEYIQAECDAARGAWLKVAA